jgi:hypothetical protein
MRLTPTRVWRHPVVMDNTASASGDGEPPPAADAPRLAPSRTLVQIVIEVGSIVLGVLLALGVSQWEEDRNNRERAAAALDNVRNELAGNLALLEIVHTRNAALVERLAAGEQVDGDEDFVPGLQVADAAWQALSSTGLGNFVDYDLLIELSRLYVIIDVYRRASYGLVDANLTLIATATALGKRIDDDQGRQLFAANFLSQFELLVDVEGVMIDMHRDALAMLDANQGDGAGPPS